MASVGAFLKTMKVDVRVIAATNRNLKDKIKADNFREDLYYRLSVFPIEIPPLREKMDDVVPLALSFLDKACKELNRCSLKLTKQQLLTLRQYSWPGNIRELENAIERAVISSIGNRLKLDGYAENDGETIPHLQTSTQPEKHGFLTMEELKAFEKDNIIAALHQTNWKTWGENGAAALLGIKPNTLAYQIKTLKIKRPKVKTKAEMHS